ncbi:MAG TPA: PQQ-binding-like beta-propeller repeat protein [Verrucomicrobiae bacterium]|nr:PQQ-binding-like beta-propeller repeat protein [Verrucomicrobiae bacterium]
MNIKVQCDCGSRFSFDVEPINGKMPVRIQCPSCGADDTALADAVIQEKLALEKPNVSPGAPENSPARPRLHLQTSASAATAPPASAHENETVGASAESERCAKHPQEPAAEHCRVCKKPICLKCMELFGYVCSVYCRNEAERRKLQLPIYKNQRAVVQQNASRRAKWISAVVILALVLIAGAWAWYKFIGSHPQLVYAENIPADKPETIYKLLAPHDVLSVGENKMTLFDAAQKKQIWSTSLNSENAAPPKVRIAGENIWLVFPDRIAAYDRKTGAQKQSIELKPPVLGVAENASGIVAFSAGDSGKELLTRIALPAGTIETQTIGSEKKPARNSQTDAKNSATGFAHLAETSDSASAETGRDVREFFADGNGALEMTIRLLEHKIATRNAMKPKGKSHLNGELNASQSMEAAQEELNDIRRNQSGGQITEDVSRYRISLSRFSAHETSEWSGEVIGPPAFFPLSTVDVLAGGQAISVFDKNGKKLWDANLTYRLPGEDSDRPDIQKNPPCVESENALYVFDQGMLSSFDPESGAVRWRLTSVGISGVESDGAGKLYVVTTSASADSIQFSRQVDFFSKTKPVLLKVDSATGKILWRAESVANNCFLSGKFIYASLVTTDPMAALNPQEPAEKFYHLHRLNPADGEPLWDYYQSEWPDHCEAQGNWILLQFPDKVQVLKFLSF